MMVCAHCGIQLDQLCISTTKIVIITLYDQYDSRSYSRYGKILHIASCFSQLFPALLLDGEAWCSPSLSHLSLLSSHRYHRFGKDTYIQAQTIVTNTVFRGRGWDSLRFLAIDSPLDRTLSFDLRFCEVLTSAHPSHPCVISYTLSFPLPVISFTHRTTQHLHFNARTTNRHCCISMSFWPIKARA